MPVNYCYFQGHATGVSSRMFRQRKHIRLRNFDYSSANAYFLTACVRDFVPLFGEIRNGICGLNAIGNEAALCFQKIPELNPHAELDEFIVMPNHVHCLIILTQCNHVYTANSFGNTVPGSVSKIMNHFKGAVTRWCKHNGYSFDWQPRFYDRVVRDVKAYWAIKNYIINNPRNWQQDGFRGYGHAMACPYEL